MYLFIDNIKFKNVNEFMVDTIYKQLDVGRNEGSNRAHPGSILVGALRPVNQEKA